MSHWIMYVKDGHGICAEAIGPTHTSNVGCGDTIGTLRADTLVRHRVNGRRRYEGEHSNTAKKRQ